MKLHAGTHLSRKVSALDVRLSVLHSSSAFDLDMLAIDSTVLYRKQVAGIRDEHVSLPTKASMPAPLSGLNSWWPHVSRPLSPLSPVIKLLSSSVLEPIQLCPGWLPNHHDRCQGRRGQANLVDNGTWQGGRRLVRPASPLDSAHLGRAPVEHRV